MKNPCKIAYTYTSSARARVIGSGFNNTVYTHMHITRTGYCITRGERRTLNGRKMVLPVISKVAAAAGSGAGGGHNERWNRCGGGGGV